MTSKEKDKSVKKKKKKTVAKAEEAPKLIGEDKIVETFPGGVMALADTLPLITKAAKLMAKGRSSAYIKKRFGITKCTLQSWCSTRTFIRVFQDTYAKVKEVRLKKAAQAKGKMGFVQVAPSKNKALVTPTMEEWLKLPKCLKGITKHDHGEYYTPEERDALMMLVALDGSVDRIAKRFNVKPKTLYSWKYKMSVSDKEMFMRLKTLRRMEFLDTVMLEMETTMAEYFKQLRKKGVVSNSNSRDASSVIKDMFDKWTSLVGIQTEDLSAIIAADTDTSTTVEGSDFRKELRHVAKALLGEDKEEARQMRYAIAERMRQNHGTVEIGETNASD